MKRIWDIWTDESSVRCTVLIFNKIMQLLTFFFSLSTLTIFVNGIKSFKSKTIRVHHFELRSIGGNTVQESGLFYETKTKPFITKLYSWFQRESLATLLPKKDALNIIIELRENEEAMLSLYQQYNTSWETLAEQISTEKRSLKEILGPEISTKLLQSVESTDIYDPTTVQSFIKNPVFESMLGAILYEGIFEFLQRVDILGNIVNGLPIIGPIRVAIIKEFKISLDKTIGGQIKSFLSNFNKVAVQRMVEFVLSPKNRAAFSQANRNVVDALISKPVNTVFPSSSTSQGKSTDSPLKKIKADLWTALRDTPLSDVEALLDNIYDKVGPEVIGETVVFNAEQALERVPTFAAVASRNLVRLLQSDLGKQAFEDLQAIKAELD